MTIEAMKQLIELYDKHCYNNDYGGIEFNKKHGYKFIEAIEALRTAIQQAEAKTNEIDPLFVKGALSGIVDAQVRDLWPTKSATHPAPGVPDDVVRDAQRYRWLRDRDHWPAPFASSQDPEPVRGTDLDAAIDAAMLAASPAQKGGAA